jgi:Transposase DDE domain
MDTITLVRSAVRGLLRVADDGLEVELRAVLSSGDAYASAAKPQIDWDDVDARQALIDSRARDAYACLAALDGRELTGDVAEAAELLARVVGQDLAPDDDGVFRIMRGTARDRVISTVDPDARHGHKSSARGFDGYKGHVAVDPDSEIITDTTATAGNAGDASVAADLIDDLADTDITDDVDDRDDDGGGDRDDADDREATADDDDSGDRDGADGDGGGGGPAVYGDAAYGAGEFLDRLDGAGIDARCKTQPPPGRLGRFSKDAFAVDLDDDTVACPAGVTAGIRRDRRGDGQAAFGAACSDCRLRSQCTDAAGGRTVAVSRYERHLAAARRRQRDPDWQADYRATRPKVERKIAHLMRRRHGGRRARMRGARKVDADFNLLAAAVNVARLAVLGLRYHPSVGWTAAT